MGGSKFYYNQVPDKKQHKRERMCSDSWYEYTVQHGKRYDCFITTWLIFKVLENIAYF